MINIQLKLQLFELKSVKKHHHNNNNLENSFSHLTGPYYK
jgi:hypothetical protein